MYICYIYIFKINSVKFKIFLVKDIELYRFIRDKLLKYFKVFFCLFFLIEVCF